MIVFVYGTLKRGERNANFVQGRFLGEAVTDGSYRLYQIGGGLGAYPGMVACPDGMPIKGELYELTDEQVKVLDRFEGVHREMYERKEIAVSGKKAWTYLYLRWHSGLPVCDTGDWHETVHLEQTDGSG